ncbi:MAG: class I SAM-dependent methyltransferase [Actinobacteria bacterium]|nr:class I SAM-dependent methyltransferase [Actinomycetota bacterium]
MTARVAASAAVDRWRSRRVPEFAEPVSMVAAGRHVAPAEYQRWLAPLGQNNGRHRKVWEWCFILQALEARNLLRSGARAIGFGVGTEPLVAALAARGVAVLATDQAPEQAGGWGTTGQHATAVDSLRRPDLCDDRLFSDLVSFRPIDMRSLPDDLGGFDIVWSSCCFEHLGSPELGFDFVMASMNAARPGGVVVHTTELDCGSGWNRVLETGSVAGGDYACFYRRSDLRRLVRRLRAAGHTVHCNYKVGRRHPLERQVDEKPYTHDPHLRLRVEDRVVTSFGLTVVKGSATPT